MKTMMKTMSNVDCLSFSYKNLLRKRTRTILTMIGVVIGSFSLIVMVGFGIGMSKSIDRTILSMGDLTILEASSYGTYIDEGGNIIESDIVLDQEMIDSISRMEGVVAVFPLLEINDLQYAISTNSHYSLKNSSIIGINPEYLSFFDYELDINKNLSVYDDFLLFGDEVILDFYDNRYVNPPNYDHYNLDGSLKEARFDMKVQTADFSLLYDGKNIGREYKILNLGRITGPPNDYTLPFGVYTNINFVKKLIADYKNRVPRPQQSEEIAGFKNGCYTKLKIKAADLEAAAQIEELLNGIGIPTYGLSSYRKQMLQTKNTIQIILLGVGIMALLISILGISNTTIMSIYERTSEIAVIKVIGGADSDIRKIFYIESGLIGLIGGVCGACISIIVSLVFNRISNISLMLGLERSNDILDIPIWLLIVSILLTTIIGIIAGAIPAKRAVLIDIIDAFNN